MASGMQLVEESFELLVSSDPNNGAVRKSEDGARFTVEFNEPIGLPKGAITPTVQCYGASIWWTIPNIVSTGTNQNNLFGFTYTRSPVGVQSTIVIDGSNDTFSWTLLGTLWPNCQLPRGSYTFVTLIDAIYESMNVVSGVPLAQLQQFITFTLNPATLRTTIALDISWTGANNSPASWNWNNISNLSGVFGWPVGQSVILSATKTGSNLDPPVPGRWSYGSPSQSQFTNNVITARGLGIPTGLYNIDQLVAEIRDQMVIAGLTPDEAQEFISFDGDNSRQLVIVTMNCPIAGNSANAPYSFEFGNSGSRGFEQVLGFTVWPRPGSPGPSKLLQGNFPDPGGNVVYTFTADRIAAFNRVNYILVHSDLVPRGIRYNGSFYQIVAQVLVDVNPGQQIVFAPFNPPICDGANLVGAQRSTAEFWLTDDDNNPIDTFGENWSARLVFKYKVPR